MPEMNVINPKAFIQAFEDMQCGKVHVAQLSSKDFEIKHEDTQPLHEYSAPEGFPNCCNYHKELLKIGIEIYNAFPNCCEGHKKLIGQSWFKKERYAYLPLKLVTTISYTVYCIGRCIEHTNWFKEITDYIDYTQRSYGQFPEGFGSPLGLGVYLHNLEQKIADEAEIPLNKKEQLLEFIKKLFEGEVTNAVEPTDLNLLISKYQQWLKIFPFEISFFNHLKPFFERQMPIIASVGETNMYTGLTGFKVKTKKELISFLVSITTIIIQQINSSQQHKERPADYRARLQEEVILANRKLELESLDRSDWNDRSEYIGLLKQWLKGEKRFLKEITSLYKEKKGQPDFIKDLLEGIHLLQKNDTNEPCIMTVRQGGSGKETSVRYWFKNFFTARYPEASVTAEEEKGSGRIDLKVMHQLFGEKIIEFKGWWNHDKKNSPEQVCSYLTDFENDGCIFMINHLERKDINDDYCDFITHPLMGYLDGTWKEYKYENTDMIYFSSEHKFGVKKKTIYHFIFNVFFGVQRNGC